MEPLDLSFLKPSLNRNVSSNILQKPESSQGKLNTTHKLRFKFDKKLAIKLGNLKRKKVLLIR